MDKLADIPRGDGLCQLRDARVSLLHHLLQGRRTVCRTLELETLSDGGRCRVVAAFLEKRLQATRLEREERRCKMQGAVGHQFWAASMQLLLLLLLSTREHSVE